MSKRREKVFVLGLDGVSFDVLERVSHATPHLREVLKYGARSVMTSTLPPWTPPAWTSIFTGVNPGKHGIYGFQKVTKGKDGFIVRPYCSRDVAVPFLHEALGFWGRKAVAVNIPLTWPAKPRRIARGNAVVVSDWAGPEVVSNARLPNQVIGRLKHALSPVTGKDEGSRKKIKGKAEAFVLAVTHLMDEVDWDAFILVYPFTDWVMHDNPEFFKSRPDGLSTAPFLLADELLRHALERVDKIIIVSDHGFTLCPTMLNVPYHLIRAGFRNPSMRDAVNVGNVVVNPKLVRLVRRVEPLRRLARKLVLGISKGRRVIPYDRFKVVMPDAGVIYTAPGFKDKVKEVLAEMKNVDVVEGKDIYWGWRIGGAPDLIVDTVPSYCVNVGEETPEGKENTGHAPHGVFVLYGDPMVSEYPPFMRPWDVGNALFVEAGIPPPSYGDLTQLRLGSVRKFNYAF